MARQSLLRDAYGNALANALPVTAAVVPGAGGAGATATQNPIAAPATQYFAVNGTPGTFIINFTSPGVAAARATVTTTLPDTFLVTVNTDPSANFYQGNPTLCVNQNMASGYQPGSGDNTDCSLRDAVAAANGTTEAVITFANSVGSIATPGTILLGHVIECNTAVTITGPGSAALTLDGSQAGGSGIFMMASNDTTVLGGITLLNSDSLAVFNAGGSIALNDVIINGASNSDMADLYGTVSIINSSFLNTTNGNVGLNIGDQGSISNSIFRGNSGPALFLESSSSVQVTNTVFLGNSSVNSSLQGAAINSQGGSLSVSSSTFSGNTGNSSSTINMDNSSNATIVNSTFTNNAASGAGTVTANGGAITVSDSTFYNNQQSTAQQIVGTATVTNSIVAGANGSATSTGNCSTCTFHGNNIIDVDPQLAALADNGSSSMQHPVLMTLLPMPGSLAVCTGAATSDTTDERGFPRPTLNGSRSCIDIGAVQTAYTIAFSTQPGDTPVFCNITPAPVVTVTEHSAAIAGVALVISDSSGIGSLTGITTGVTGPGGTTNFNTLVTRKGGTQSLAATANFAAVSSAPFRVTAVPPIVMLAISPALQTYGTAVTPGTFSASATYAGNAVPGTFAYIATPNSGSPVTVAQGTTVLPAASYRVVADFTPTDSANYNANISLSGATTYTVAPGTAAITFDVPDHTFGDAPFIVSAISLSTGAFMYSLVSGPATVDGNAVTLSGPGTVVLQAAQAADANYITNSKQASFTVTRTAAPFTLSDAGATTYSVILAKGTTARTTITVTPSAGFSGAIAMSCALLPANADCSFSSPTLNFFGSGAAQTTGLSIQTQTSMKAMLQQPGNRIRSCLAMTFWLPSLLLAGSGFRNRGLRGGSRLLILGIVMLWCIGATGLTGCGSNPTPINTTAEGTYMFNIVATHGSITQRLPVTLTIQ